MPQPSETATAQVDETTIHVQRFTLSWASLLDRLTFGAFGRILDLKLSGYTSEFWIPRIIRDLGISTADRKNQRFFHYCELLRHADDAAWDPRSAWARANVDVRRDFAFSAAWAERGGVGGTLSFEAPQAQLGPPFRDRLAALQAAIEGFGHYYGTNPTRTSESFTSTLKRITCCLTFMVALHRSLDSNIHQELHY